VQWARPALYRIGVDEISYKRGRKFLTIVADHDTGNVVWVGKERSKAAFEDFFAALGPERSAAIEAISLDGNSIYLPVTREQIPQARICLDPFHVIKWTNEVVESVYRAEAPTMPAGPGMPDRRNWRRARFAVRAGRENLDEQHRQILGLLRRHRYRLWRTWELKEQLRELYRTSDPADARAYLQRWVHRRETQSHPGVRQPRTPDRETRRCHRCRRRARPVQLPPRRHQRQDPAHSTTRLRLPQPRRPNRSHLPLPRRSHPGPAHGNLSSRTPVRIMSALREFPDGQHSSNLEV
jgi:hypothetical protein